MPSRSRSSSSTDDELRLPRAPGVFRRFWSRHPVLADALIAIICLLFSLVPPSAFGDRVWTDTGLAALWPNTAPIVVVAVFLGCSGVMFRRRFPVAVFIGATVVAHTYFLAPVSMGGPLICIAGYSLAVYRSNRACVIGVGVALGTLGASALTLGLTGMIAPSIALNAIVGETIMAAFGALIGTNVGNRKRYVAALIERSQQLVVERDQHAQLAAAAERDRIARELHDIVAHSLTVIVALAEGVVAARDVDRARPGAMAIATTGREALRDMRATLGVLRDADTDAAPLAPLPRDTAAESVASARAAGFDATLTVTGDRPDLPTAVQLAISRIVQEGITNVMRHARGAEHIDVRIAYRADAVEVTILDDGDPVAPPPASTSGYGLRGLRERVELAGGTVTLGPRESRGWRIHALFPRTGQS